MSQTAIHTTGAPSAVGPYSQGIIAGNLLFLSGIIGLEAKTATLVAGGFNKELQQVFNNLLALLEAGKANINQIAKITVYLTDMQDFPSLNEMMKQFFKEPYPARTTIQVAALPKGAVVELDVIVAL